MSGGIFSVRSYQEFDKREYPVINIHNIIQTNILLMSDYNVRTFKTMTSDNNDNELFDCDRKTYISIIQVYLPTYI